MTLVVFNTVTRVFFSGISHFILDIRDLASQGAPSVDKRIKELYTDKILKTAALKYSVDLGKIKKLGGFENFIYEYEKNGSRSILRITHSYHRSIDDLNAEMEWVEYLAGNGADVAAPVLSAEGKLAEKIDIGNSYFVVSAVEKATGTHINKEHWNKTLFTSWGRAVGKLHRLTKDYKPVMAPRFQWHEEYLVKNIGDYLPIQQASVICKIINHIDKLKAFYTEKDNYGLIHTDVHSGNFFIDNGEITIFDFDDCAYKHFISDIAIAVFYSLMSPGKFKTTEEFAEYFLDNFMIGYLKENMLDDYWMKKLPDFLKLREMMLYVAIHRSVNLDNPGEWVENFMGGRHDKINNEIPLLSREII